MGNGWQSTDPLTASLMAGRRLSLKQQLRSRCWVDPMMDSPPCDPADPPAEGDTGLLDLPEDCLGLVLDLLDPVTVAILERVSRSLHTMIQAHQYWRKALIRLVHKHPYLSHSNPPALTLGEEEERLRPACKKAYRGIAKELNTFWRKNDTYKPSTQRNCQYFCHRDDQQKIVNIRVTGEHFLTILGPRTRSDPTVYTIRVFSRSTRTLISEVTNLNFKPEYLVFSPRHDLMVAKAHECSPSTPDTLHVWSLSSDPDPLSTEIWQRNLLLRLLHLILHQFHTKPMPPKFTTRCSEQGGSRRGGTCPHWPPGSVGRCRLHREMGAFVHGGAEGASRPQHPPHCDRDGKHDRQAHTQ